MITRPNKEIEVSYQKYKFGNESTGQPIKTIKSYLKTGYIRVVKKDTLVWMRVNKENGSMQKGLSYPSTYPTPYWRYINDCKKGYDVEYISIINNNPMKLFYFKIEQRWKLRRDPKTNEILQYEHDLNEELDFKYIIGKGIKIKDALNEIKAKYQINNKKDSNLLHLIEK
jgi:hypothetical protein